MARRPRSKVSNGRIAPFWLFVLDIHRFYGVPVREAQKFANYAWPDSVECYRYKVFMYDLRVEFAGRQIPKHRLYFYFTHATHVRITTHFV